MSIGGRSNVATPAKRTRVQSASGAGAGFSLTVGWLNATDADSGGGNATAGYAFAPNDAITGWFSDYAVTVPISVTLLTSGSAAGAGPYTTEAVQVTNPGVGDRQILCYAMEAIPGGTAGAFLDSPVHPDVTLTPIEQTRTGSTADKHGNMANFAEAIAAGSGTNAPFVLDGGDPASLGACWLFFALDNCTAVSNQNTSDSESSPGTVTWFGLAGDVTSLLVGCVGRVPGPPVGFAAPFNANVESVSGPAV